MRAYSIYFHNINEGLQAYKYKVQSARLGKYPAVNKIKQPEKDKNILGANYTSR